jgi:hypothetical protein
VDYIPFNKRHLIRIRTRLGVGRSRCESPMQHIFTVIQGGLVMFPESRSLSCHAISEGDSYVWLLTRVPRYVE